MSTLSESMTSSTSRPLPVRKRADLEVRRQQYQGREYYVLKEPIGLNYFRFEPEEYALLSMLDGKRSLVEIQGRFEQQFPPQKISLDELSQFVGSLHRSGLVISDSAGQGRQMAARQRQRKKSDLVGKLTNVLAIRFRGIDPDNFLSWLYPKVRWFFAMPVVIACLLLALCALGLVLVQLDTFLAKLPTFGQFFAGHNWFLIFIAIGITKVLHELGHALTCKHFGGECHEMGAMLLVLTPCLYVNVSDSWMLPSKWKRAAIGAAGMYVELIIASLATFLWWFSAAGVFNALCLNIMFVCSVSTILFNGNPLLRYDGYYILSDLVEIPNLRSKASQILSRTLGQICLGIEPTHDPFLPTRHRGLFATYAVAAAIYRWIITFSILWFLYKLFEPYRLELIGQVIALAAVYGLVGRPLWQLIRFFHVPGRMYQVKRARMAGSLGLLAVGLIAVFCIPLPAHVYCSLELQPRDAVPIYVDTPGKLSAIHVRAGQVVTENQPLCDIENDSLHMQIEQLVAERDRFRVRLDSLQKLRFRSETASLEVAQVRENLATVEDQLRQKEADLARMRLVTPVAGTILPPPTKPTARHADLELPTWSGTPLQARNLGATLDESTLFCQVGDPKKLQAILAIDQADIQRIGPQDHVEIEFTQAPGQVYKARIEKIAKQNLKISSDRLSSKHGGNLATQTDSNGQQRPVSTTYQALVPLEDDAGLLRSGLSGQAKVHVSWETVASRGWRFLARTFNFEL